MTNHPPSSSSDGLPPRDDPRVLANDLTRFGRPIEAGEEFKFTQNGITLYFKAQKDNPSLLYPVAGPTIDVLLSSEDRSSDPSSPNTSFEDGRVTTSRPLRNISLVTESSNTSLRPPSSSSSTWSYFPSTDKSSHSSDDYTWEDWY